MYDVQIWSILFTVLPFVTVFAVIVGMLIHKALKQKAQLKGPQRPESSASPSSASAPTKTPEQRHAAHVADAHAHAHKGTEEHYDEIVGSLGDINSEGCEDLDGVRFISHDANYEQAQQENKDYSDVLRVMVLGEVLNDPRFKKPYRR